MTLPVITSLFAKDIQRPIEGVIKADDASHVEIEVEEYVLTNEAAKGIDQLLEAYTNYTNANGVWISGFFGSGKSHLLKMLAHLLGNVEGQDYSRQKVSDTFKDKTDGDSFLLASLNKAERIPAKSLLFNIAQKISSNSKGQTDSLLKVFVKVFDESRGYYGNQGHVARFERDLDNRGQYEDFKAAYARIAGRDWKQGREEGVLEEANVAKAYAEVAGLSADAPANILTKYRNEYKVSIEDFAEEVAKWLETQEPGFRLNFFVDEVGQFIGSDTHLMLDLQTIAESLNTKCQGRAWIFVTSQEDMEKVLGDRTKAQANDFSKIQARFATRLKLTSADVEEVIRKRLLTKNEDGAEVLSALYAEQSGNFRTIFEFTDGGKNYRNFVDEDHFIGTYPFVTYQFPLFQAAIESISDHNVFEGRNSSVGERSMLGVVQQVAKDIGDKPLGALAGFDQMFAGIRASLKSAAHRHIDIAERNLGDKLGVRLLKALFLVKYVDDFMASPHNLAVLIYDDFAEDITELTGRVKESLDRLEQQVYIQRNGTVYEYLTDEERRIESEIKDVDLDSSEITAQLHSILAGDVIKQTKLRYEKNGRDYPFGFRLDDQNFGKQQELTVHFFSPDYAYDLNEIKLHSAGRDELRVVLDPDAQMMRDLRLVLKTKKYLKRKQTSSVTSNEQRILQVKATQNAEREKEVVLRARQAVGNATLIHNVTPIDSNSHDAIRRVTDGFQALMASTYKNLSMLGDHAYTEADIARFANPEESLLDAPSESILYVPGEELRSWIERRENRGEQVTVKAAIDEFSAKPYGWDLTSIDVLLGWLVGLGKVAITQDSNTLRRTEVATALRNTAKHPHLIVQLLKEYDNKKVTAFHAFCQEFLDISAVPNDPLELGQFGADELRKKRDELTAILTTSPYPFVQELAHPVELLDAVVDHKPDWYLTQFDTADELLDAKEDTIQPITAFLHGGQRTIIDDAQRFLTDNAASLSYLADASAEHLQALLEDPKIYRGNKATTIKAEMIQLRKQLDEALAETLARATEEVTSRRDLLHDDRVYTDATDKARSSVDTAIEEYLARLENTSQIPVVNSMALTFAEEKYPALFDQLTANPQVSEQVDDGLMTPSEPSPVLTSTPQPRKPRRQTISINKVKPVRPKMYLDSEADVDEYLAALRASLLDVIADDKRITL